MGEITTEVSNDLVEMAWGGTVRKVYPEIAEFFATRKAAELEWKLYQVEHKKAVADAFYEKATAAIQATGTYDEYVIQRDAEGTQNNAYREAERKHSDFLRSGRRQNPRNNPNSWEILAQSPHKEVKWIVDNCMEYEGEATTILKHLPATLDELWTIAKDDNGMCGVFDKFFEAARAAGILKDEDLPASAREWAALTSYINRAYGSGYMGDMRTRVIPVVKAEVEYAVAQARAEWQQQDEARAENIRRNRSEGARKAAATRAANRAAAAKEEVLAESLAVAESQVKEILEQEIPQISTQSAMTGEIICSDIRASA